VDDGRRLARVAPVVLVDLVDGDVGQLGRLPEDALQGLGDSAMTWALCSRVTPSRVMRTVT
jgi:hypothetical protein